MIGGIHRTRGRRAFSLVEIMLTIGCIAVTMALVLPRIDFRDHIGVETAAQLLMSDVTFAQVENVTNPSDPLVVVLGEDGMQWWIARATAPENPVTLPGRSLPHRVQLGVGLARHADDVRFSVANLRDRILLFDAWGGLDGAIDPPAIRFTSRASWATLRIDPVTGEIQIQDGRTE